MAQSCVNGLYLFLLKFKNIELNLEETYMRVQCNLLVFSVGLKVFKIKV